MKHEDIIQTILKDSNYHLSLFTKDEINALRDKVFTKEVRGKESPFVICIVRDKNIQLKPEEVVRQLFATRLMNEYVVRLITSRTQKGSTHRVHSKCIVGP